MAKNDDKKQLSKINQYLSKLTDPKQIFLLGVVRGVGVAVGATVVAGILFWILTRVFNTVEDVPVLDDFIQNIRDAIGNSS
jgi:hypothetical protein